MDMALTQTLKKAIEEAQVIACRRGSEMLGTEHLLLAFMEDCDSTATEALIQLGISPEEVTKEVDRLAPPTKKCEHCNGSGKAH